MMNFRSIYNYLRDNKGASIVRIGANYYVEDNWLYPERNKHISSTLYWAFYKRNLIVKTVKRQDGSEVYSPLLSRFHRN